MSFQNYWVIYKDVSIGTFGGGIRIVRCYLRNSSGEDSVDKLAAQTFRYKKDAEIAKKRWAQSGAIIERFRKA